MKQKSYDKILNCDDDGITWSAFHGLFAVVFDKVI